MATHDGNGNGDAAPTSEGAHWDSLVKDPGLRLALFTLDERIKDHANEHRERSDRTDRLVQDCCAVANKAFGSAARASETAERIEAAQATQTKLLVKVASALSIDTPDSLAPPPIRERLDSLQSEVDVAEKVAAEARAEAKAAQARADAATAAASAAATEASGAHKVAGEAKLLNGEVLKKLGVVATGLAALTAAAWAIAKALGAAE
jgi:hypothetical protein